MTRTSTAISSRFKKLLQWTALTDADQGASRRHIQSVLEALTAWGVLVNNIHKMGSTERGSAIHNVSDIDLLVVVKRSDVTWGDQYKSSETVLSTFRSGLRGRFPQTEVGKDGQAVVVEFGDGTHPVDVVPAFYLQQGGPYNHPIFAIPTGTGDWKPSSPSSHNRFIATGDERAAHHLVPLAQVFKFWRTTRAGGVPISGFHVEMRMAAEDVAAGVRTFSQKFYNLLALLTEKQYASLNDPLGISGRIDACATDAKRRQAFTTLADAAVHAEAAVIAEHADNFAEAWRQWNIVFNDRFPRDGA